MNTRDKVENKRIFHFGSYKIKLKVSNENLVRGFVDSDFCAHVENCKLRVGNNKSICLPTVQVHAVVSVPVRNILPILAFLLFEGCMITDLTPLWDNRF
ncbi:hypothetical protein B5X24_HaOG216522 [Helicoverpa armigera]|nr:hypothetical protein B5X24_HaOG216522 [Helicoverpa armigera]